VGDLERNDSWDRLAERYLKSHRYYYYKMARGKNAVE
jgi:hypothetical protein